MLPHLHIKLTALISLAAVVVGTPTGISQRRGFEASERTDVNLTSRSTSYSRQSIPVDFYIITDNSKIKPEERGVLTQVT